MKKLASVSVILFVAIFLSATSRQDISVSAAQASKGKKIDAAALYQAQCAKCHGADGKGIESLKGADIPNFADEKWQASRTDQEFTEAINNGKGIMPGFKDAHSAQEIRAMVNYVRSFAPANKTKKKKQQGG
jgi:mono/diheme cytochrome c family protein